MTPVPDPLVFALPKGRLVRAVTPLFRRAGIDLSVLDEAGRRLRFELPTGDTVLLVKPADVPTYVDRGVAHVGVAGLDTLLEADRDLYEPLDLGVGRCRMVVAEPAGTPRDLRRGMDLRVATKYPRIARAHYLRRGIHPDVIELAGSVELGAVVGLADQIVDLVESGSTLRENGLREVETVLHVSARLVVGPAALKLRSDRISRLVDALAAAEVAHA
ncbi:MAG: ATP phosphoribosyltransferase [Deltaproteobacteria bacterium]|nr:MAG: ATP phosphoribosyltransferase [Deltaproteobacteria bacterium]